MAEPKSWSEAKASVCHARGNRMLKFKSCFPHQGFFGWQDVSHKWKQASLCGIPWFGRFFLNEFGVMSKVGK